MTCLLDLVANSQAGAIPCPEKNCGFRTYYENVEGNLVLRRVSDASACKVISDLLNQVVITKEDLGG